MRKQNWGIIFAGIGAGAVNGLFGAGGGMILVPLLTIIAKLDDAQVFPCSVSIILPICLVSLTFSLQTSSADWFQAAPYLIGSAVGGLAAGILGEKIPTVWLHRLLGILILWGGIRYLC